MEPIEKILLPDGFKFTGRTLYSSRSEIETPYLYADNDYVYLYLTHHDDKYLISDYCNFSIKHEELLGCSQYIVNRLNAEKIGYDVRIQDDTIEFEYIEHVVLNDEELSVDLFKIAKTLSELSEYVAENYAKN